MYFYGTHSPDSSILAFKTWTTIAREFLLVHFFLYYLHRKGATDHRLGGKRFFIIVPTVCLFLERKGESLGKNV